MSALDVQLTNALPAQSLLWRGAMYEALALAFSYPDEEVRADLSASLEALNEHEATGPWEGCDALEALSASLAGTAPDALAADYNRCFAGEVACSSCETEYEFDAFAKARQLADIAGFYGAFGLKVAADRPTPADSLASELEFMSHLVMRQALASVNGWDEQRQICEDAQRQFLEDHLGRWAPAFCRTLFGLEEGDGFYAAATALCERFLAEEIAASGANPRPAARRCHGADDESAFTCMFASPDDDDKEDEL